MLQRWWGKLGAAVALAVLVVLLVVGLRALGAFQRVEGATYDARLQWTRANVAPHPAIEVILIDEASLKAMEPLVGRFPWPRSVYADMLRFLKMGGARAVVFDVLFPEPQQGKGEEGTDDRRFRKATAQSKNVFHAAQMLPEDGSPELGKEMLADLSLSAAAPPSMALQGHMQPPFAALAKASAGLGIVNLKSDADGVYRRVRPFFRTEAGLFPSLGLVSLVGSKAGSPLDWGAGQVRVADRVMPLTPEGRVLVNMAGDFESYSASGVLASLQSLRKGKTANLPVYPDAFANKVVFIGASATGLEDVKPTSLSPRTPGVLIHASLASNFLRDRFLEPVPRWVTLTGTILLALLTLLIVVGSRRLWVQVGGPVLLAVGYGGWCLWRFQTGIVYDMTPPLAGVGLSWLAGLGLVAVTEGREKLRVRRMFSQYVSKPVLAELVARPEAHLTAEVGRTENLTVLFSDIRSFTSLSERLPPDQVIQILNRYLGAMAGEILDREGTLDKFIGDAIMAFWGAPVRVVDHAERGVRAALAMQKRLAEVNRELEAQGWPALETGVGLHSAPMILGNIGSEQKLDFTVIGDNVNLASRLEGLTKAYQCPVVISEATRAALPPTFPCAVVDQVQVKGKDAPTRIYWPLALPEETPAALEEARERARLMEAAFTAYQEWDWDRAIALYEQLPADAGPAMVLLERCRQFRAEPPSQDWAGVHKLDKL